METFGELRNAKARLQTPSSMFPEEGNEKKSSSAGFSYHDQWSREGG